MSLNLVPHSAHLDASHNDDRILRMSDTQPEFTPNTEQMNFYAFVVENEVGMIFQAHKWNDRLNSMLQSPFVVVPLTAEQIAYVRPEWVYDGTDFTNPAG